MTELMLDPDCKDPYKHDSCIGGACECICHVRPLLLSAAKWVGVSSEDGAWFQSCAAEIEGVLLAHRRSEVQIDYEVRERFAYVERCARMVANLL